VKWKKNKLPDSFTLGNYFHLLFAKTFRLTLRTHFPWGDFVKKSRLFIALSCLFGISSISFYNTQKSTTQYSGDAILLALVKNDLDGLEDFLKAGGDLDGALPEFDGKNLTIAEGIAHFERVKLAHHVRLKKYPFTKQRPYGSDDILRIAVRKNNPELLREFLDEDVDFGLSYSDRGLTLLHMASAWCSHKLMPLFQDNKKLNWDQTAKDGSTPLTVAAEKECLPMLTYWKERGADFMAKDGRGKSAFAILKANKNPLIASFIDPFKLKHVKIEKVAQLTKTPDFYKKRSIPKDQIVDHSALLGPEDRPLEAIQTAEYSEFSD
jgi:hypothetical protein